MGKGILCQKLSSTVMMGTFKITVIKYAEQRNNCLAVTDKCLKVETTRTEKNSANST